MAQYTNEYSAFPENVMTRTVFKDVDNTISQHINALKNYQDNNDYVGGNQYLENLKNQGIDLSQYLFSTDYINFLDEQTRNLQIYSMNKQQQIFYLVDDPEDIASVSDVWIGDISDFVFLKNLNVYPYSSINKNTQNVYTLSTGTHTENGLSITLNNNGIFEIGGMATENTEIIFNPSITVAKGTYSLSGCPLAGRAAGYSIVVYGIPKYGSPVEITRDYGDGTTFVIDYNYEAIRLSILINKGTVLVNKKFKPMLVNGNKTFDFIKYVGV